MFCPKCGQPQASEAVRFCSKCGFELDAVKALVGGETEPDAPAAEPQTADPIRRKRELTKGAFLMFLFALCAAAITVDMPRSHSARIVLLIVAWLLLTLFINLGPLVRYFFGHDAAASFRIPDALKRLRRGGREEALPSRAQAGPVGALGAASLDTGEIIEVPSVTERTTNLLGRQ